MSQVDEDVAILAWAWALARCSLGPSRQWPPRYPTRGSLLSPSEGPAKAREEWGAAEWRAYAQFLEKHGAVLLRDLKSCEDGARKARAKLTRRKKWPPVRGSLLTRTPPKPGRKPAPSWDLAGEVLALKEARKAQGRPMTDRKALAEIYAGKGLRRSRAFEREAGTILNKVVRLRKKQDKS